MLASRWFTIIAAAVSLVGSFLITLWLTEPDGINRATAEVQLDGVERLRRSFVYDNRTLGAAAQAAGLVPLDNVRGHIDEIQRLPDGQVRMTGWAADVHGDGSPLSVVAFGGGRGTLLGRTDGPRDDVAKDQKLSQAAARHVAIVGSLPCERGQTIVAVAINKDGAYAPLTFETCR